MFCFFLMKLDWPSKKKKISCVVQYFFSLHSLSRWIQLLLPMYDGLCIFGMDKTTSSPRSGPTYTYPDSLTDHNAICYSSWDHISLSSFFLIYPVYQIYIYIYMCVCVCHCTISFTTNSETQLLYEYFVLSWIRIVWNSHVGISPMILDQRPCPFEKNIK